MCDVLRAGSEQAIHCTAVVSNVMPCHGQYGHVRTYNTRHGDTAHYCNGTSDWLVL
jgi:hypothetical protein